LAEASLYHTLQTYTFAGVVSLYLAKMLPILLKAIIQGEFSLVQGNHVEIVGDNRHLGDIFALAQGKGRLMTEDNAVGGHLKFDLMVGEYRNRMGSDKPRIGICCRRGVRLGYQYVRWRGRFEKRRECRTRSGRAWRRHEGSRWDD
jgi:hypothetical protein